LSADICTVIYAQKEGERDVLNRRKREGIRSASGRNLDGRHWRGSSLLLARCGRINIHEASECPGESER
jgi:hypothetical protein